MSRKPKFRPEIRRIKLNSEQAVLSCACYNWGYSAGGSVMKHTGHSGYTWHEAGWHVYACNASRRHVYYGDFVGTHCYADAGATSS